MEEITKLNDDELAEKLREIFYKEVPDEVIAYLEEKHANNFSNEKLEQELSYYFKYNPELTKIKLDDSFISKILKDDSNIFHDKLTQLLFYRQLSSMQSPSHATDLKLIGVDWFQIWKSDEENKTIIVMSDTHTLEYSCDDFGLTPDRFIEKMKNCSSFTIDVFAEVDYERDGVYTGQRNLNSFLSTIKAHESFIKSDKLRIHYGDMRPMFIKNFDLIQYKDALTAIFYFDSEDAYNYILSVEPPIQFSNYITLQHFIVYLLNDRKILKQKAKLDEMHLELIEKYENLWIKKIKDKFIDINEIKRMNRANSNFKQLVIDFRNYMVQIMGIPGDVYVLCRLFSTKLNITHAILYFGSFHNIRYTNFLKSLNFQLLYDKNTIGTFECLDISDVKPFLDQFCGK